MDCTLLLHIQNHPALLSHGLPHGPLPHFALLTMPDFKTTGLTYFICQFLLS